MSIQKGKDKKKQFKKLMKAIRRDPENGLREFYDTYAKLIWTTAISICRSSYKADEVVDDVMRKVWKFAETKADIDNPEGWIYAITANTAKDALRERYDLPLNEDIISGEDPFKEIIDRASFEWMICDLSEIEQEIMIHRFVSLNTFQEIADLLNKPLPTIATICYRALEKIKKKFEESET